MSLPKSMVSRPGSVASRLGTLAGVALALAPAAARADTPTVPVEYTPPPVEPATVTIEGVAPHAGLLDKDTSPRTLAFVAAGVAVVGIGVGTAFGVLALNKKSDFDASPTVAGANAGNEEALIADVAFGTAAIAGVTSIVLFLTRNEEESARPAGDAPKAAAVPVSFTWSPLLTPHVAGAAALLRF